MEVELERQLDYTLSGYNVHDALEIVDRLIAERDGKVIDKEYVVPESLKIFSAEEYEKLQKVIDENTAHQLKIKEFETLRRVNILREWEMNDDDDNDEKEEVKKKEEKKETENDGDKDDKDDKTNETKDEAEAIDKKKDLDAIRKSLSFQMSLYNEGIEEIDDPKNTWELSTEYEYLSVYSKTMFTEKDSFYGMKLVGTFDCSL